MKIENIKKDKVKQIRRINFIGFLLGWTIIMLLGSDFPPPFAFIYLVVYILGIDIVQVKYLDYFLKNLDKRRFFMKHLSISALFGAILSLIPNIWMYKKTLERSLWDNFIWISVVTVVAIFYGIFYYILNKWLIRKIR